MDREAFAEIQRSVAAGDCAGAEEICARLADREANDPSFWKVRGDIAVAAARWGDAEAHYRWAMALAPEAATPWLGLARVHALGGREKAADVAAARALQLGLDPEHTVTAREIIANAHFARGEFPEGRKELALLVPGYRAKFAGGNRPANDVLRAALPAALCAGDIDLVRQILAYSYPHAGTIPPMAVASLAPMEEWCKRNGVPCRVLDPPRAIDLAPTSPYSRPDSYKTDPILFASIPGGQWVAGWDFAIGSDGTVLEDSGYLDIKHVFNHAPHVYFPAAKLAAHRTSERIEHIDEDVLWLSAPWHNHIGHWQIDFLPRLLGRTLAGNANVKIVIPDTLKGAKFAETLAMCSLGEDDIIRCRPDTQYRFRTLNVYRAGHSMPPHPRHVQYLRDLLRPARLNDVSVRRGQRFYFSRARIASRLIVNEAEFQRVLDAHGFVTLDLAESTFAEQREILAEAEILIGALGTDLFAMYFAPRGCTVIVMQWDTSQALDPCVPQTCAMLGLTHQYLQCPITRPSQNARSHMDSDFTVDCVELDRRLREIDAARRLGPVAAI